MAHNTFYNEILTDHNLHPAHKHELPDANYELEGVNPSCGDDIILKLKVEDGQILDGLAVGDGPVDASFLAIEQIVGHHYDLDDLQVRAVTEGREAMGETVVRLRSTDGRLYSGRGISTDIIGSSIRAYVSAVNKIIYEEGTL